LNEERWLSFVVQLRYHSNQTRDGAGRPDPAGHHRGDSKKARGIFNQGVYLRGRPEGFPLLFGIILAVWIGANSVMLLWKPFDPYPFILLNWIQTGAPEY
jgi:Protein of unknown function (DUF1003)